MNRCESVNFFQFNVPEVREKLTKKKYSFIFAGAHTHTHTGFDFRTWPNILLLLFSLRKIPIEFFFSLSLIYSWFTLTESYTTLSVYVCMYVCVWFLLIHIDFFIQKKPVLMLMPVAIVYKWKSKHNQTFFYIIIIIIIIFNMHVNPGNSFVIYLFIYLFFYISILPNQCVCVLMASKMMNFFVWNFQHKNKMEKMYWEREWRERE